MRLVCVSRLTTFTESMLILFLYINPYLNWLHTMVFPLMYVSVCNSLRALAFGQPFFLINYSH